ncbi:AI-2E family transporter [Rhizobium rhizophilum]|uniref:AI-2E family transporter n=1 Tax=Rhizobium rhizophilum TaxID=1850373 RepID=A0ABY2R1H6_9HYPH|nr:AI-2E family transporter [Rhizobium rhizophilum]THV17558.1 AI-2E family transporter [Rhizobium rhizophilum]
MTSWGRRPISVTLVFASLLILLLLLPHTVLMIFGGLLLAILLRSCGVAVGRLLSIGPGWGVAVCLVSGVLLLSAGGAAIAPAISEQVDELWRQVPETLDSLKSSVEEYAWGREALERASEVEVFSSASGGTATRAVSSIFGYAGSSVLLVFIALYGAFDPHTYKRGFLKLFAPSARPRAESVLSNSVQTLQSWLSAQLISMTVVGVLTGLGLWFIGIPLALVLGLIAGLLAFIPNLGPVLAATPGLLLAVPDGMNTVLMVLGVYLVVQTLESYIITPLVQKEKVSLPPLLVICSQLAFGSLFGIVGLALATPLTALGMQLVNDLYIDDYLEREHDTEERAAPIPVTDR